VNKQAANYYNSYFTGERDMVKLYSAPEQESQLCSLFSAIFKKVYKKGLL